MRTFTARERTAAGSYLFSGEQVTDAVRHERRRSRVGDRRGQGRQQTQLTVRGLEQDRAAVRARVWLIKGRDQRPIGQRRFIPPNSA
jgi:hypothetical protein